MQRPQQSNVLGSRISKVSGKYQSKRRIIASGLQINKQDPGSLRVRVTRLMRPIIDAYFVYTVISYRGLDSGKLIPAPCVNM